MPKVDDQGRFLLPSELRKKAGLTLPKEIALCYDFQNATITICDPSNIVDKSVIAFRKLDAKGRFIFPREALDLLGITEDSLLIVFLKNNELCIKGMDGTRI